MLASLLDRFSTYTAVICAPGVIFGRFFRFLEFGIDGFDKPYPIGAYSEKDRRGFTGIKWGAAASPIG